MFRLLHSPNFLDNPARERTGSDRDQAHPVQHDDHGNRPTDAGDRVDVTVADRGEGRERPPVGGGQVTNHSTRGGGFHRINRQGKHDNEDCGVPEELHSQLGESLVLAVGSQVNHGEEADNTPSGQQHNRQVHKVVRDEVESTWRQIQANAVVGSEEGPQNQLQEIKVSVVRFPDSRTHNGRSKSQEIQ